MNNTPLGLLLKTYEFVFFRFILCLGVFYPGYKAIMWGINKGREWFGINLFVADLLYGYCGLAAFILFISLFRSIVLHYLQYAQVASMTALLEGEEIQESLVKHGFKTMMSRIGSVSLLYVSDNLLKKVVKEVSSWLLQEGNIVPAFLKKGLFSRIVSDSFKTIVYCASEVMASYLYVNKDVGTIEGAMKATSLYVQSWKTVLKSAFMNTIYIKILGKLISWTVIGLFVWLMWGQGFKVILATYIAVKVLGYLLKVSLVEPYQVASMLVGYYQGAKSKEPSEEIMAVVAENSDSFKDLIFRGKEEGNELATKLSGTIINQAKGIDFGSIGPEWLGNLSKSKGGKPNEKAKELSTENPEG